MLARAVQNFANDLQVVSDAIKSRTVTQIKGALQKKAFDEAGIVIQSQVSIAIRPQYDDKSTMMPFLVAGDFSTVSRCCANAK